MLPMRTRMARLALICCCFAQLTLLAHSAKRGKQPPTSWIDPDTGHRVVRLTQTPGSASFYFNVNSYTPDGKEMVYTTPDGISVLNMETWKTRPLVQGHVRTIEVGHKTPTIFYIQVEEHSLYATNVDTGVTSKLATLPPGEWISTINADETLAAGAMVVGHAGQDDRQRMQHDYAERGQQPRPMRQPMNKGEMMEHRQAERLPMVLFTLDLLTGKQRILLHSDAWLNHLQFSPTDPHLLMYCHEGPWQKTNRIWMIRTDGTHNTLVQARTMFMEIAGHEFWGQDGKMIWYDWQTPKGQDFWLAGYNIETGERIAYHMDRDDWSIHFNVSHNGELFCGDGGDPGQVAHAKNGEWIYLFHPEMIHGDGVNEPSYIQPGVLHAERLVNMSQHKYHLEPNVSFTPDDRWVVFRSNMFGATYVFAVQVAKAEAE